MKRIYNYLIFKFNSTKCTVFFIIITIYQFSIFIELISKNTKYNVYDLIMRNFEYLSVFYCINLFFLVMLYNLYEKKNFYNYLNLRFRTKQEVYNANVIFVFVFSIIIVAFMNFVCVLQCINNISFNNYWSPYFYQTMTGQVNLMYTEDIIRIITLKLSPFSYVMYSNLLIVLYLSFISMIFVVSNIIFKKRAVSFILVIILNAISMILEIVNSPISKLSFAKNIFFITASRSEINNGTFIILRIVYWVLLITITYFIGNLLTKKIDYNYGE